MICYPMGLPEWDFIRQCLEGREDLSGTDVSCCLHSAARVPGSLAPLSHSALALTRAGLPSPFMLHARCPNTPLQFGGIDIDAAACHLWFASRAMAPEKPLSDYLVRAPLLC